MGASTFTDRLLQALSAHPAGLSEFELIKWLETAGQAGFDRDCLRGNLSLFQTHFILFHTLYRLRDELFAQRKARLDISPLCIRISRLEEADGFAIDTHDALRDYYLDLDNLQRTRGEDVDELLGSFWERYIGNDERREALSVLELEDPVDWPTIKTQHRRLAMRHHPDRGGDEARLQAINAAMERLARSYK